MTTTLQIATSYPFIELSFPSELGYEKIARDAVAAFARRLGCDRERVEDLKTALGEACINAIEHGNARAPGLRVDIRCTCADDRLTVDVCDSGMKLYTGDSPTAGIDLKLYQDKYGLDLLAGKKQVIEKLLENNLVKLEQGFLLPTIYGLAVADSLALI